MERGLQMEKYMLDIRDMFQWQRFVTPEVVPLFFWVATFTAVLVGLFGFTVGMLLLSDYPLIAIIIAGFSLAMICLATLTSRLIAEFVLIAFRTNDHIYAIRVLAEPATQAHRNDTAKPVPHAA
jgi:Domain of unknown function (DUF4282)